MPGLRLKAAPTPVPKFAVVGMYARPEQDQFVLHVALLRDGSDLAFGHSVAVWHCTPPIIAGEKASAFSNHAFDECKVHAAGFLDDLSPDDVAGIQTILAEIDTQTPPMATQPKGFLTHYIVNPPVDWVNDKRTGNKRFRKFSCVGFVCECYQEGADIQLLNLDPSKFPEVNLATLTNSYGDGVQDERRRVQAGIEGEEPWRIALAGYVLHSLNRSAQTVRETAYTPTSIDEASFPLDASHNSSQGKMESIGVRFKKGGSSTST